MSWHEIINIILFNIKSILKITITSSFFLMIILLFVYPNSYKATVSILPPENNNQINSISSLLGSDNISSFLTGGTFSANSQLFIEILKSRSAAEYVVRKLKLINVFNSNDESDAIKELIENLNLELTKEGIVKLDVVVNSSFLPGLFSDSKYLKNLASKISNTYVEALDFINRKKLSSKAKNARIYIERQLKETRLQLDSMEIQLMTYQKNSKSISLPEQIKASIDAAANLKSQIIKTEIEAQLLSFSMTKESKVFSGISEKLNSLKDQYKKIELGDNDYLLSFISVPEIGRDLAVLLREVKILNQVYLYLQQEYYKEKIQENRDNPTVEILDKAIPPKKAFAPRIVFATAIGGLFFFLLVSIFVILKEKKIKAFIYK